MYLKVVYFYVFIIYILFEFIVNIIDLKVGYIYVFFLYFISIYFFILGLCIGI